MVHSCHLWLCSACYCEQPSAKSLCEDRIEAGSLTARSCQKHRNDDEKKAFRRGLGIVGKSWEIKSLYRCRLGGIFSIFFFPPGPYAFPGKMSKIIRTGDFSPIQIFRGTRYWYEFLSPEEGKIVAKCHDKSNLDYLKVSLSDSCCCHSPGSWIESFRKRQRTRKSRVQEVIRVR